MRIVVRIRDGVPEVVASDSRDVHVLYLDMDEAAKGRGDIANLVVGGETIGAAIYCQQTDEMRYMEPGFIDQVELLHDVMNEYGDDWREHVCRVCLAVGLDESQPGAGDWWDGMCPECADKSEPKEV